MIARLPLKGRALWLLPVIVITLIVTVAFALTNPLSPLSKLRPSVASSANSSNSISLSVPQKNEVDLTKLSKWSDPKTWGGSVPGEQAAVTIPAGKQVLLDVSPPALKSLLIEGLLACDNRDLALSADWIMVHKGGSLICGSEQQPFHNRLTITLTGNDVNANVMDMGAKVLGVMGGTLDLHGDNRLSWTRLAATALRGSNQITLDQSVNWQVGDRIVITSTDYDPLQAEEFTITAVSGAQVTLNAPLKYMHWGVIQNFGGQTMDERAEVGLLSHNITIQGDSGSVTNGFGGHTMIMAGSTTHLSNVEFFHMGQKRTLARYPLHWHMASDATGSYIRDSSIHNSFNRCLTIHGTNNLQIKAVVAYDTIGHCFFMEDGVETGNVLEQNLGILTRSPRGQGLLGSDNRSPATFWITNPNNIFRGNVAAGSQGFGYWFSMPEHPTGLSKNVTNVWPRYTPLKEFSDNVVHSTSNFGIDVDDGANPNGSTTEYEYMPRQNGTASSPSAQAVFKNLTIYKTHALGGWLRGSNLLIIGAKVADTQMSFIFAAGKVILQDALIIGESENKGTPVGGQATGLDGRTLPGDVGTPLTGFGFYDGPNGVQNVTFVNFRSNSQRPAGALSFNPDNNAPLDVRNFAAGIRFINANPAYVLTPTANRDGGKSATIYDSDGSVTGKAGQFVTANSAIMATGSCQFHQEWNAYACPQRYGGFSFIDLSSTNFTPFTLQRSDGASVVLSGYGSAAITMAIPGQTYIGKFGSGSPRSLQIDLSHLKAGDTVNIQLTYSAGTKLHLYRDAEHSRVMTAAGSLGDLAAGNGNTYYYDSSTGVLHLLMIVRSPNDWARVNIDVG
jgi:cell migration-inducing and hyaluronan-binding protein